MMKFVAYHGDPAVKADLLANIARHRAADDIVRGIGWDPATGKGCAVGCSINCYDHSLYPVRLGIPEWLARVEDTLFEGMSEARSRSWPEDFAEAIPVGADLEKAKAPFLLMVLRSTLRNFDHFEYPQVFAAVNGSIALWERADNGSDDWHEARHEARRAAESAAWSAARSTARSTAWSTARSAAWSAACSAAESAAESAAWSAAWSATESAVESAAGSAAWRACHDEFADGLLSILSAVGA